MHASTRGTGAVKKIKKTIEKKSSKRKAPKTKRKDEEDRTRKKGRTATRGRQQPMLRHVSFKASTNPPRAELRERVREREAARNKVIRGKMADVNEEENVRKKADRLANANTGSPRLRRSTGANRMAFIENLKAKANFSIRVSKANDM